jgi:alkanesulfonate monooxygenase SsuD/methylene tetrahydromethanopterin reductase-like flavin-dependent oxidoreductase (luciferase family)
MEYYAFVLGEPNAGSADEESLGELLDEIKGADGGGFTGCFFAEHHNDRHQSLTSRPNLLIAAAAMQTSQLRLGTMVTVLGLHQPFIVAEEIATLDALSKGRIEYGIGAGGFGWSQVGIDRTSAKDRLEEGVLLLRRLFAEGESSEIAYEGRYWSGTKARVVPSCVQKPHPPLWITGHGEDTIRRAARLQTSFCTGFVSCQTASARRDLYRRAWSEYHPDGGPPGRTGHMILVAVGDSRRDVREQALPAMRTKLFEFAKATLGKRGDPSFTFDQALRDRYGVSSWNELIDAGIIVYGTAEDCIEQLQQIRERGADVLLMQPRFTDIDRSFSRESFLRLAQDVLPMVETPSEEFVPAS